MYYVSGCEKAGDFAWRRRFYIFIALQTMKLMEEIVRNRTI